MSESWKTSSARKPIINSSKIFTNRLVTKSGIVYTDIDYIQHLDSQPHR